MPFRQVLKNWEWKIAADSSEVYGIVMDVYFDPLQLSLTTFITGDASIYKYPEGGILGGSGFENVRKAVGRYHKMANNFLPKAERTDSTNLPDKNTVQFYFLTNQ